MLKELAEVIVIVISMVFLEKLARSNSKRNSILVLFSFFYLCALIYVTMIKGGRGKDTGINTRLPLPFYKAIISGHYGLSTNRSVLNILLFIPFGYQLPQFIDLWHRKNAWWKVALWGLITSLLIETSQLVFHRGVFEIDDLVKNTVGAFVGYELWKVVLMKDRNNEL